MIQPKTGCVIQGNIRGEATALVLRRMRALFPCVILSTWTDEECRLPGGDYHLVLSARPPNAGLANRNLQRRSTLAGLLKARELGCHYVLKWRSDMLPLTLSSDWLLAEATRNVPDGFESRIVMSAFRNLSVTPDWFSSFPDMYAFAHIGQMMRLWCHEGFDESRAINVPPALLALPGLKLSEAWDRLLCDGVDVTAVYDAHAEFYALFKDNLQRWLNREITHAEIMARILSLHDHRRLRICWFGSGHGRHRFRTILQAQHHGWMTEGAWRRRHFPKPVDLGWVERRMGGIRSAWEPWRVLLDQLYQAINLKCNYQEEHNGGC
jgi:hypothetical protein